MGSHSSLSQEISHMDRGTCRPQSTGPEMDMVGDCSPPPELPAWGSACLGFTIMRILEWIAIFFTFRSSSAFLKQLRSVSCLVKISLLTIWSAAIQPLQCYSHWNKSFGGSVSWFKYFSCPIKILQWGVSIDEWRNQKPIKELKVIHLLFSLIFVC